MTKIADLTLKEIFVKHLGENDAEMVLNMIQKFYDEGIRGQELKEIAERELGKTPGFVSGELAVLPIMVVAPFSDRAENLR